MTVMDIDEIFYCCLYGNNEDEVIIRHLYRDREYEQGDDLSGTRVLARSHPDPHPADPTPRTAA